MKIKFDEWIKIVTQGYNYKLYKSPPENILKKETCLTIRESLTEKQSSSG